MKLKEVTTKVGGYVGWLLVLLLAFSVVRNAGRVAMVRSEVRKAGERVEKIKAENATLLKDVEKAESEVFIEKQIRDKLGLAKEGEAIVILPDEETLRKLAPGLNREEETLPDPVWKRWIKLFL
jgi:cell division protein FtsB